MNGADTFAVWINKRAVTLLLMPFKHELQPRDSGWQIQVLEPGRLTARFIDGGPEHYDLQPGDTLLSSGDEIYISLKQTPKAGDGSAKKGAAVTGSPAERGGNAAASRASRKKAG